MKRSEKKRFGKGFMSSHDYPNEQTKEAYLIEIGELGKRIESYETKFDELDTKNKQFREEYEQRYNDQHDTVTLYTKTLEQRVDEITDLRDRIMGLQQVRDSEKASYERQLQQLRAEFKETKDQLIADNMMKGTALTQLDEFRSNRSEFTARLAELKLMVEAQKERHAEKLRSLKEKHENDRQRLKRTMIERVHYAAHEFRQATSCAMAETTKRAISENIAIDSQLTKMSERTADMHRGNQDLRRHVATQRQQVNDLDLTQSDLARDYVSGCKLIGMLDKRVKMQDDIIVQSAVSAARTDEMRLESDVLRDKLVQLTESIRERSERNAQLQRELRKTRRRVQDEDAKVAGCRRRLKTSAEMLARLLTNADPDNSVKNGQVNVLLQSLYHTLSDGSVVMSGGTANDDDADDAVSDVTKDEVWSGGRSSVLVQSRPRTADAEVSSVRTSSIGTQTGLFQQDKLPAERQVTQLSVAECEELLSHYAPRSVIDRHTLPPLDKLGF